MPATEGEGGSLMDLREESEFLCGEKRGREREDQEGR